MTVCVYICMYLCIYMNCTNALYVCIYIQYMYRDSYEKE